MLRYAEVEPAALLDEVTSSHDYATESTIHDIIGEDFTGKGHTASLLIIN
jgi:ABC-type multidrug transport system fused ATPase/permease subunit